MVEAADADRERAEQLVGAAEQRVASMLADAEKDKVEALEPAETTTPDPEPASVNGDRRAEPTVALQGELEDRHPRVKSRYARQSAKLPRIGEEAGSVLASMANLRKSLKDSEDESKEDD